MDRKDPQQRTSEHQCPFRETSSSRLVTLLKLQHNNFGTCSLGRRISFVHTSVDRTDFDANRRLNPLLRQTCESHP